MNAGWRSTKPSVSKVSMRLRKTEKSRRSRNHTKPAPYHFSIVESLYAHLASPYGLYQDLAQPASPACRDRMPRPGPPATGRCLGDLVVHLERYAKPLPCRSLTCTSVARWRGFA